MSDTENTDAVDGIGKELDAILAGKSPLTNLKARQTGAVHYSVLSARNGNATIHRVNLSERTCTCGDMEYNTDDKENEVCAHLAKAALVHPQLDAEQAAVTQIHGILSTMEDHLREIKEIRDNADATAKEAGAKQRAAEASETAVNDSERGPHQSSDIDPKSKAEDLKDAYDDVIDDMQVKVGGGYVWIQTGQDTPDNLKMPGAPKTFQTLLKEPDRIEYVHENHDLHDRKPGQYFKNAIRPSDVDDYINEVVSP